MSSQAPLYNGEQIGITWVFESQIRGAKVNLTNTKICDTIEELY